VDCYFVALKLCYLTVVHVKRKLNENILGLTFPFDSLNYLAGGWNMDGRGASIWDTFSQIKGRVFEDHNGDVACNSYQLWKEDLKCIQQLGLTHYRLSISWSRLLPDGTTNHVNPKGAHGNLCEVHKSQIKKKSILCSFSVINRFTNTVNNTLKL